MPSGVILLAAGEGRRFGRGRPKQLCSLDGKPLFMRSLSVFCAIPSIKEIVIVASDVCRKPMVRSLKRLKTSKRFVIVPGGAFRGASVRNGFKALSKKVDLVLVHDSARPMIDRALVRRVEKAARRYGAALAAWPLPDTLKSAKGDFLVKRTLPRRGLWLAQTPQGFRMDVAKKVLLHPSPTATDDVELAERRGIKVKIVKGGARNIKVTVLEDLAFCRAIGRP